MDGIIGISGVIALLLVMGGGLALLRPSQFDGRWLVVAAMLVLVNDAMLTNVYGLLPDVFRGSDWN
ncbi:hypothetical protein [uncultured Brevundimonas sp.]|uniref:hypothetical protein n=1 Tax=uncultured Brevundimonas sp. TaxID=213418 RepID=UPI0025DB5722|nr:hypothetical protein [uncultured Brevundimonas sp.]